MRMPGRSAVGLALLVAGLVLLAIDIAGSETLDPFKAPPPIAFGSGRAPSGAHCATAF